MKKIGLTIGKKLWILSGISIFVIVAVVMVSSKFNSKLVERLNNTTDVQLPVQRHSLNVSIAHDKIRAAVFRGIFASQIDIEEELQASLEELVLAEKMIKENSAELKKRLEESSILESVVKTNKDIDDYLQTSHKIFDLLKQRKTTFALELQADFQTKFEEVNKGVNTIKSYTEKEIADSVTKSNEIVRTVEIATSVVSIVGIVFSLVFSFVIIRDLMKTLMDLISRLSEQEVTVMQYTSDLEQIASNLSESTSNQAAAVEQTAASLEEITAMVTKSADHSKYLAENSQKSKTASEEGVKSVQKMLEAMTSIDDTSKEMMVKFEASNQRILEIIKVINEISNRTQIINDIVFQTKLLSFNASVEAARAGEHGKGFAVVAHEIGALAAKSGESSKEINDMLASGVNQVNQIIEQNKTEIEQMMNMNLQKVGVGSSVAKSCGESLEELAKQVKDVSVLSEEIYEAMNEQRSGVGEINKSVGVFSSTATTSSTNSSLAADISVKLREQFGFLHDLILELKVMVDGKRAMENEVSANYHAELATDNGQKQSEPIQTVSNESEAA